MTARTLLAGALLAVLPTHAAVLESHAFEFTQGHSRYHFTAQLQAPAREVLRTLLDPARIALTNDDIRDSRVLSQAADGSFVREIRMEQCVIGICFDIRFVEQVREADGGRIEVTQLPYAGTFRGGTARWTVTAAGNGGSRLAMEADQEPSFWVPPVIGPYLMRRTFEREVRETVQKIEDIANAATIR